MEMGETNFAEVFRCRAAERPSALAIQFKENRLSYAQLAARIEVLNSEFGSFEGKRIIMLLPDSLETYLFYLFLFLAKAVVIPISIQATSSRIKDVIERVRPSFVFTNELLHRTHREVLLSSVCLVVGESNTAPGCGFGYQIIQSAGSVEGVQRIPVLDKESLRYIIFTSGSTGTPKGVCLSEANITSAAWMMVDFLPVAPTTRSMVTVPLYDYYGLIQIFGHILGGGGFIFGLSPAFLKQFHEALRKENVTDLVLVPHTLRKLMDAPEDISRKGMGSLRRITSSSDILTEDLLLRVFNLNFDLAVVNIYGLTEAGRACYRKIMRDTAYSKSIGRPSKGVEVTIDGDEGNPGEIVIKGPNVMLGYFQGVTNDRVEFKPCSEMRTGDMGYFNESGEIVLLGRRDHMINFLGAKIHPTEIEMAALGIGGIREAYARVVHNQDGQPGIHLDVVCSDGSLRVDEVQAELRKRLPRMFVPASIDSVSEIARTELGAKVIR